MKKRTENEMICTPKVRRFWSAYFLCKEKVNSKFILFNKLRFYRDDSLF